MPVHVLLFLCYMSLVMYTCLFYMFSFGNSATSRMRVRFSIGVASVVDLYIRVYRNGTLISNSDWVDIDCG